MTISPKMQALLYGTVVTVSVTVGGLLWRERSTPGGYAKVDDFIEIYQATLERTLATEYWDEAWSNYPPAVAVYTNREIEWVVDPAGHGYQTYGTNGVGVWTNYWAADGEVDRVYTNHLTGTYRLSLPGTGAGELTGGEDRYLWNAWSNITFSGFSEAGSSYNGTFKFFARVPAYTEGDINADLDFLFWFFAAALRTSDYIAIYTNGGAYLLDLGPRDSIGGVAGSIACMLYSSESEILYTERNDSPINGPWRNLSNGSLETNAVASVSGFASNFVRDAVCRWYINKAGYYSTADRYTRPGLNAIGSRLRGSQLDALETHLAQLAGVGTYITTNDLSGLTNAAQWDALCFNWTNACQAAGIPLAYTNQSRPTTGDVDRLSLALSEFQWTRDINVSSPWFLPGELDGNVTDDFWEGNGESFSSWEDAVANAEANWQVSTYVSGSGAPEAASSAYYYYDYISPGVAVEYWSARLYARRSDMAYRGASTNIAHTTDFFIRGVPNTRYITTNTIFHAQGTTLSNGVYLKIGSVGPDSNAFPHVSYGNLDMPEWCDDPETYAVWDDEGDAFGATSLGFQVEGAEIIQKWGWQYNEP